MRFLSFFIYIFLLFATNLSAQPEIELLAEHYANDRLEEARDLVNKIYPKYPSDPVVLYLKGVFSTNAVEAFGYYQACFERDSYFTDDAVFRMAQFYYIKNEYNLARKYFSYLTRHFPDSRLKDDAQFLYCQSMLAQGKIDSVKLFYKAFIKNSPRSPFVDVAVMDLENLYKFEPEKDTRLIEFYTVQVGAFLDRKNAQQKLENFKEFDTCKITEKNVRGKTFYIVLIGTFTSRQMAEDFAKRNIAPVSSQYYIVKAEQD